MVHVFGVHQFERQGNYLVMIEQLILATLISDPADVGSVVLHSADDRTIPPPADNLKSNSRTPRSASSPRVATFERRSHVLRDVPNCSPGAIYKLFPSKEDFVIAAFRDIMRTQWLRTTNFAAILEEGSLTELLYSSSSIQNEVRQSFTMETTVASTHSDKIRLAV
jgi:hypothetical protein